MKKILFIMGIVMSFVAHAQLAPEQKKECEILLKYAQNSEQIPNWVYDACDFRNPDIAWYDWAPYVSQKQYAQALYVLCDLYPDHEYGHLYCEKAAELKFSPALYKLASEAKKNRDDVAYEAYLQAIVDTPLSQKGINKYDRQFAYLDLAQLYYTQSKDPKKRENIVPYLQKSAEMHNPIAASSLAIILYGHQSRQAREQYERYMWQAITAGCPAAEEFLGITNALNAKTLPAQTANEIMQKLLFTCDSTRENVKKVWTQDEIDHCGCPALLGKLKTQENKPFIIVSIHEKTAVLRDKNNNLYTVSVGDKITDGYVVEDIRATAVKVKKQAVTSTLLLIDSACVEICTEARKQAQEDQKPYQPYQLTFTEQECEKLAENIEFLTNPLKPFRGIRECQLQDWARWGKRALEKQRNKHLFLLANYEKSNYIPSFIAFAQVAFAQGGVRAYPMIADVLKKAVTLNATDELSKQRKHYAYCMLGALYLEGPLQDSKQAVQLLEKEKDKYPYAMNMLGVAYANGWGVEKNTALAQEYFDNTIKMDEKQTLASVDAINNLHILSDETDTAQMHYGHCDDILNDTLLNVDQILQLYSRKDSQ